MQGDLARVVFTGLAAMCGGGVRESLYYTGWDMNAGGFSGGGGRGDKI